MAKKSQNRFELAAELVASRARKIEIPNFDDSRLYEEFNTQMRPIQSELEKKLSDSTEEASKIRISS
jgi:hypothetical protein